MEVRHEKTHRKTARRGAPGDVSQLRYHIRETILETTILSRMFVVDSSVPIHKIR